MGRPDLERLLFGEKLESLREEELSGTELGVACAPREEPPFLGALESANLNHLKLLTQTLELRIRGRKYPRRVDISTWMTAR
jgi:hypothetical protein